MPASFAFSTDGFKSAKAMDRKLQSAIYAGVRLGAARGDAFMKHNAPWHDRTSNARNGLFAKASKEATQFIIVFAHSVDYGIYLELGTRYMHARPIIQPAMNYISAMLQTMFNGMLDRLR